MAQDVESILGIKPENSQNTNMLPQVAETSLWSFQGRIGRGSFWARFVSLAGINVLVSILIYALAESSLPLVIIVYLAYVVFAVWFGLAFQIKRWHDLDKSGWMVLLNITIIALPIVLIILGCVRGTQGPNRYGIDPLPSGASLNLSRLAKTDSQSNQSGIAQERS